MDGRQLHLFKGKRLRGTALPRAKEFELHCMVADVLRRWCSPAWRYTHMPMGERRDPATAMRLKRMGVTPGWADFLLVGPRREVVWLELKRPGGGMLSDSQDELAQFLKACGHQHIVTNDFQHAFDLLRDLGIVTDARVKRMTPTAQLIRLIQEQDREMLRKLEALVPDGPKDKECIEEAIAAIRKRIAHTEASA